MFQVEGIDHVALRVSDQEASKADHGAAHSINFEDPDGLPLELTTYEV